MAVTSSFLLPQHIQQSATYVWIYVGKNLEIPMDSRWYRIYWPSMGFNLPQYSFQDTYYKCNQHFCQRIGIGIHLRGNQVYIPSCQLSSCQLSSQITMGIYIFMVSLHYHGLKNSTILNYISAISFLYWTNITDPTNTVFITKVIQIMKKIFTSIYLLIDNNNLIITPLT